MTDQHPAPLPPSAVERRWVSVDHPGWSQAHAPSVLPAGDHLLVAWFAGTAEGTPDNRVWLSRRRTDEAWPASRVLAEGDVAHWNPVLAHGPDGAVWLFYKRGAKISAWSTWVTVSHDDGATWGEPRPLVPGDAGGRGPVKNPPVLLPSGTWLAPASTESWAPELRWQPFVDRSTDGGLTWQAVEIPVDHSVLRGAGLIQPALWLDGGRVHALMRSSEGWAYHSSSDDDGVTWSPARPTPLPNNNSGLCAVAVPGGVVVVHNPVSENWGPRCPLVLSFSADAGRTWRTVATVEDGITPVPDEPRLRPSLPGETSGFLGADDGVVTDGTGEYSYPAAALRGTDLHVVYTWQRRGIVSTTIPLDRLNLR